MSRVSSRIGLRSGWTVMRITDKSNLSLGVALFVVLVPLARAQVTPRNTNPVEQPPTQAAAACDEQRAVALVQEQAAEARSFEKPVAQISVMTRAADLLWAYREEEARSIFAEAYELAAKYYRQKGEEQRTEGAGLLIRMPDQRFVVLRAIARHDAEWSRRLAEQAAEESRRAAEKTAEGARGSEEPGEKVIDLAEAMLSVNQQVAINLARASFAYPLTVEHAQFLFDLAQKDKAAADALALEAINAYAVRGTTEDLSSLSVYVFALPR